MRRQKRKFSAEFKAQILSEIASGRTISDLARVHDVTLTMICRWKHQARDGEIDAAIEAAPRSVVKNEGVDPRYVLELEMKLRNANEKLGEMYVIVEGLKKIQTDFQNMRNARLFVGTKSITAQSRKHLK